MNDPLPQISQSSDVTPDAMGKLKKNMAKINFKALNSMKEEIIIADAVISYNNVCLSEDILLNYSNIYIYIKKYYIILCFQRKTFCVLRLTSTTISEWVLFVQNLRKLIQFSYKIISTLGPNKITKQINSTKILTGNYKMRCKVLDICPCQDKNKIYLFRSTFRLLGICCSLQEPAKEVHRTQEQDFRQILSSRNVDQNK